MAAIVNAELGSDFAGVDDFDESLSFCAGRQALAECEARGLMTPHGSLFYDEHWGYNMLSLVGSSVPTPVAQSRARAQVLRDERVHGATVRLARDGKAIAANVSISDSRGSFPLTVTADALGVKLLMP
jgi:hypothetical protein